MILTCSLTGISQTEIELLQSENSHSRGSTTPTVIQSTSEFDKDITINESSQEGSLDITDPEIDGLVVSPNPTKGHLSVSVPADYIGLEIRVVDMTGRFVGNSIPIVRTTESFSIEGESGMYLLMIRTRERVITERIQLNMD